jgi:hypothetical protein
MGSLKSPLAAGVPDGTGRNRAMAAVVAARPLLPGPSRDGPTVDALSPFKPTIPETDPPRTTSTAAAGAGGGGFDVTAFVVEVFVLAVDWWLVEGLVWLAGTVEVLLGATVEVVDSVDWAAAVSASDFSSSLVEGWLSAAFSWSAARSF